MRAARFPSARLEYEVAFFFTSASSFTIHIVRSLPAPATGSRVEPAEANSGRRGARIRAEVSDINKVDQVVVSINIDGAARLEASDTAKVAQQMALLLNIVTSRISVDSSAASRRVPTRRRGTKQHRTDAEPDSLEQTADVRAAQEVVLRILAGSPADADTAGAPSRRWRRGSAWQSRAGSREDSDALLGLWVHAIDEHIKCCAGEANDAECETVLILCR